VRIRDVADVTVEIEEIRTSLAQQAESGHWTDLLRREVRPALVVGLGLAVFQQITGINTVICYAPKILQTGGYNSASGAILATVGVGIVNVAMTILAMSLIDRAGRRPLLLVGIAGMIITLGVLGLSFPISNPSGQLAWIAVICLMGYVASFAISLGPIFWLLIAEIYPLKIRGLAEGRAATFNWASNLIVSLTFLTLLEKLRASSTFLLYAFASVASWLFAYYFVPETRGRTLEEIEAFWRARHHVRQTGN
jgi:SP family galactose:H+ symporter-like MFS transporter